MLCAGGDGKDSCQVNKPFKIPKKNVNSLLIHPFGEKQRQAVQRQL